ncbi:hypothetical protein EX30DRAFT_343586 [Ascodesmis nigricans]|uniref:Uncharacterized protein n=1 Tax=Ascodesmis nigricans TaxID=341454 RepID=A0A4S2MRT0_9PEZI|nr:hypothetical protein EX30DRAFT_343586 [Ascodesmis nigricans]
MVFRSRFSAPLIRILTFILLLCCYTNNILVSGTPIPRGGGGRGGGGGGRRGGSKSKSKSKSKSSSKSKSKTQTKTPIVAVPVISGGGSSEDKEEKKRYGKLTKTQLILVIVFSIVGGVMLVLVAIILWEKRLWRKEKRAIDEMQTVGLVTGKKEKEKGIGVPKGYQKV